MPSYNLNYVMYVDSHTIFCNELGIFCENLTYISSLHKFQVSVDYGGNCPDLDIEFYSNTMAQVVPVHVSNDQTMIPADMFATNSDVYFRIVASNNGNICGTSDYYRLSETRKLVQI